MRELREHLLRSGIAPATVKRYLGELHDHYEEVVFDLAAAGLSHTAACDIAWRRLGTVDELSASLIADPRFRSIASRAPLAAWVGLPLLAMISLIALLASAIVLGVRHGFPVAELRGGAIILLLVAPVVSGWAISADARRRRANWLWPAAGIAATITLGAATKLQIDVDSIAVALAVPAWPKLAAYAILTFFPFVFSQRWIV